MYWVTTNFDFSPPGMPSGERLFSGKYSAVLHSKNAIAFLLSLNELINSLLLLNAHKVMNQPMRVVVVGFWKGLPFHMCLVETLRVPF